MNKLMYDTDLIGDDLLTVMLIVASKKVDLMGITAYGRLIGAQKRCETVQSLLEMLKAKDVELVPGASRPLVIGPIKGCTFCDNIINKYILNKRKRVNNYSNVIFKETAANYIVKKVNQYPNEISLLCTGPLTNLALAVSLDPSIVNKFKSITIMGGTYNEQGNSTPVAEANFYNDPEAARIVLEKFSNINIVTLDTTLKVTITDSEIPTDSELTLFIHELIKSCCNAHVEKVNKYIMPLHDALAFLSMINPSLITYMSKNSTVETQSIECYGKLVCSKKANLNAHNISIDVNVEKTKELFMSLIKELL